MRAAKVQVSLRICAVSPEPPLLAHTGSESRGTFRQKARSLAPLNGWACAVKIFHDGMLEDTNLLDAPHVLDINKFEGKDKQQNNNKAKVVNCSYVAQAFVVDSSFLKIIFSFLLLFRMPKRLQFVKLLFKMFLFLINLGFMALQGSFFLNLGFMTLQYSFIHLEPSQSSRWDESGRFFIGKTTWSTVSITLLSE